MYPQLPEPHRTAACHFLPRHRRELANRWLRILNSFRYNYVLANLEHGEICSRAHKAVEKAVEKFKAKHRQIYQNEIDDYALILESRIPRIVRKLFY